jgi:phosphatidylglycerophosphatase A
VLIAFGLFRIFDIFKPWPISWADQQSGAFGVMLDDIVAGALVAAALILARPLLPGVI